MDGIKSLDEEIAGGKEQARRNVNQARDTR